jgi:hypothetical protein
MRKLPLFLILIPSLLLAAPGKHIQITINPTSSTLVASGTQQFTATVSGTPNTAVTWSATAGTVTSGLFTAPTVTQTTTVYVTAASTVDPTKTATAAITIDPAAQHTVDLNWSPSTDPNITGYNVYRGSISGGPYSQVNTESLVASTLYTDATVTSGQTYYYVVTAVDSSGVESGDSNETQAVIPIP